MKKFFFSLLFLPFFISNSQAQSLVKGKTLNGDSIKADLEILEQALTQIHPGIYRYNTKADIEKEFTALRAKVGSTITEAELMKLMAQSITKIRCGHTYLNPWNMRKDIRERLFGGATYFPLGFKILDGHFYVTHNASDNEAIKTGAEILSINGYSIKSIYKQLSRIGRSDGHNFAPVDNYLSLQNYTVGTWEAFDLYFPLFFPLNSSQFEIEFQNYKEKKQSASLPALKKEERAERMKNKYGTEILENERWSLSFPKEGLAYIKLGTFAIWNWKDFDHKVWFAETFQKIKEKNTQTLIVDIRENGGGLTEPRNELITYLIHKEITCNSESKVLIRTNKMPSKLVPYAETWNKIIINGIPKEYYTPFEKDWLALKEELECSSLYPKENSFKGQIYLFGGSANVSATASLLQMAEKNQFGTFVGNTCGGNLQGTNGGEYVFFYLPYSQMEVDIPLKYYYQGPDQKDKGLAPQVRIDYQQKDILENKDPHS